MAAAAPRLRQAVLAARELTVADRLRDELGLAEPFADPGVWNFGLQNAVFALGDTFLEVVSPFRDDGKTYGTPTWIWSVVVDDGLYVRAYNGPKSRWYQAALSQKKGRIIAAGITKEVTFEPVNDGPLNFRIDDAYRAKYKGSPYLDSMIATGTRAAAVKIIPREND